MSHYGMVLGPLLLLIVAATAIAIGMKAAHSIATFREENHRSILDRGKP